MHVRIFVCVLQCAYECLCMSTSTCARVLVYMIMVTSVNYTFKE